METELKPHQADLLRLCNDEGRRIIATIQERHRVLDRNNTTLEALIHEISGDTSYRVATHIFRIEGGKLIIACREESPAPQE